MRCYVVQFSSYVYVTIENISLAVLSIRLKVAHSRWQSWNSSPDHRTPKSMVSGII